MIKSGIVSATGFGWGVKMIHTRHENNSKYCIMDQRRPVADPWFIGDLYQAVSAKEQEQFFVFSSDHPKYFSLGGDLKFFAKCVRERNQEALYGYGMDCIRIMYSIFNKKAITVAFVKGSAFGGGFEVLTSFDYVVAHPDALFALPEIKLNMFPGMGIYTFLSRKIGTQLAHKIITSGLTFTPQELLSLNIIDQIAEEVPSFSNGQQYALLAKKNTHKAVVGNVWKELSTGISLWIECVMNFSEDDLNKIDRIVALQDKTFL